MNDLIKAVFKFLHHKLSQLENYLLLKISRLGARAENKLDERIFGVPE